MQARDIHRGEGGAQVSAHLTVQGWVDLFGGESLRWPEGVAACTGEVLPTYQSGYDEVWHFQHVTCRDDLKGRETGKARDHTGYPLGALCPTCQVLLDNLKEVLG